MPFVSVPAIYDGEQIRLLENAPVQEPYRVVVVFVAPEREAVEPVADYSRFWASLGAWEDDRPVEATLQDIHAGRRSKADPPDL